MSSEDPVISLGVPGFTQSDTERIQQLISMVGGPTKAASLASVSRTTIYEWQNGKARIPLEAALALSRAAGVSLDWVATGWDRRPDLPTVTYAADEDFVWVPRLEVRASAGSGIVPSGVAADRMMMLRESWLRSLGISPANAQFVLAEGDSMRETICDGDLLLIDRGSSTPPRNGLIYVFTVAGSVVVKRVQVLFDGTLVLSSDNERYGHETVPPSRHHELLVEGQVKWYGRSL